MVADRTRDIWRTERVYWERILLFFSTVTQLQVHLLYVGPNAESKTKDDVTTDDRILEVM